MVKLTPKQKRIAKAKAAGLKNKDIGQAEYPTATPGSQAVLVSRELKKTHVAQYLNTEIEQSLAKHNVTKEQYFLNIGLAMQAEKQNQFTGEITPDIQARLSGNKMAEKYLFGLEEEKPLSNLTIKANDEIELQKIIFRRND